MRVVVLGSGGQLGSELCRQLASSAVGLDRRTFDIRDGNGTLAKLTGLAPDVVINCAAYTLVDRAEQEADLCQAVNAEAVGHIAEACRRLGCGLIHLSTDYVFGADRTRTTPYREDDLPGPQGVYARSKLQGEQFAAACPQHCIIRTCGLYGRRAEGAPNNFVETMLRLAREHPQLRVVDDQHCTPSYVAHVARAILFLMDQQASGIYHVVNQGATTWYDFAAEIFRRSGVNTRLERITTAQYGAVAARPAYSVLDTTKYHRLGGPRLPDWPTGLGAYLATQDRPSI